MTLIERETSHRLPALHHDPGAGADQTRWLTRVHAKSGRLYLRIVAALEEAIRAGDLQAGDQIPPQRTVADILGIDFTTVTRAYSAARLRGLVQGSVGRGTFVRAPQSDHAPGLIQFWPNTPPTPGHLPLTRLIRESTQDLLERMDLSELMADQRGAGPVAQRLAGAKWLEPMLGEIDVDRILVCGGAQGALHAILATLMRPGDGLVVSALTYPGVIALARRLHLRLVICRSDAEGLLPDELTEICARERPRAVFCTPTLQPGPASTMSETRRRDLAWACRQADIILIEDDAYGRVPETPIAAISTHAPERGYYLTSVAKAVTPWMRHAYVAAPDRGAARQLAHAFIDLELSASPLTAAVIGKWLRNGTMSEVLGAIRQETQARRALAASLLPAAHGGADSYHVWLELPDRARNEALRLAALEQGVALTLSDCHAADPAAPNGLFLALGAARDRTDLQKALRVVDQLTAPVRR